MIKGRKIFSAGHPAIESNIHLDLHPGAYLPSIDFGQTVQAVKVSSHICVLLNDGTMNLGESKNGGTESRKKKVEVCERANGREPFFQLFPAFFTQVLISTSLIDIPSLKSLKLTFSHPKHDGFQ